MSKAVERPVWPCSRRYWKRSLVSSARAEAGELAHGPEPAAVHRGMDAAREGVLAGVAEVASESSRRRSSSVYRGRTCWPEIVSNRASRSALCAIKPPAFAVDCSSSSANRSRALRGAAVCTRVGIPSGGGV